MIIHSLETGTPRVVYSNVANNNLIENLPAGCCVEVPCVVDKNGIQPVRIGRIPSHLAALMQTNINVQALTVEAVLKGDPNLSTTRRCWIRTLPRNSISIRSVRLSTIFLPPTASGFPKRFDRARKGPRPIDLPNPNLIEIGIISYE